MTFTRFNSPFAAFGLGLVAAAALVSAPRTAVADTATLSVPITIDIPSCSSPQITGTPPNLTITCGSSTPATGAGSCGVQLTTTPSPITKDGGSVSLAAVNCSIPPTAYGWTRSGGAQLGNGATASDTLPANTAASAQSYTYTLTWCVGATCGSKSTTLSVPGTTTTTGNPTGALSCSGFNKTLVIDVAWSSTTAATRYVTQQYGGFGANDALVVRFTPPAGASFGSGALSGAEYSGPTTTRTGKISTSPCDFSTATQFTLYNAFSASTFNLPIQVGGTQLAWTMLMAPGTTYYLNIKNTDKKGIATCAAGKYCDMFVDFLKPQGT